MKTEPELPDFSELSPDTVLNAAENALGVYLESVVVPYNSYVNRVYGLKDEDGGRYVAKFYRPGRWTADIIAEEHAFLADCAQAELPVAAPIELHAAAQASVPGIPPNANSGCTPGNSTITLGSTGGINFTVFPYRGGRTFDLVSDNDYLRAGALLGRLHGVSRKRSAPRRPALKPLPLYADRCAALAASGAVHPDLKAEFLDITGSALAACAQRFAETSLDSSDLIRIHGDCHRGNILEAADGSLILIDFDDMMTGPAIQDLWLLLPGHLEDSGREMELLLEGYTEFSHFNRATLTLVEPLRFMRMIYFLDWQARQRNDALFRERNPDWGSRAFWIRELEDLADQARWIAGEEERVRDED